MSLWLKSHLLTVVAAVVVALAVGVASARVHDVALLVALGVLAVGVVATDPMLLVSFAVPAVLLMARAGGVLSVSDVVLAGSTVVAMFLLRGHNMRSMAPLVWGGMAYLAAALPTTILNPYSQNIVEWVHELVLVLGSLAVGYAIGRFGRARLAIGMYVIGCVGIAVAAVVVGFVMLAHHKGFGPAYLPQLDKNLIGSVLAAAIIIVYARPAWFSLSGVWSWTAMLVCAGGLFASESRQAMIGLAAGLLVIAVRRRPDTGRFPRLPWLAAIPIIIAVWGMVDSQLESDNQFNSAYQRLSWYAESYTIWKKSPVFGVGLRWWYTNRFGAGFQPPNAEYEALTTVGVVGMLGFFTMFIVALVALWRLDPWYGTVGVAIVFSKLVAAQFDLYWVAGQASFLWLIAGICYGALRADKERMRSEGIPGLPRPAGRTRIETRPSSRRPADRRRHRPAVASREVRSST